MKIRIQMLFLADENFSHRRENADPDSGAWNNADTGDVIRILSTVLFQLEKISYVNPYIFSMEELFHTRFNKLGLTLRLL